MPSSSVAPDLTPKLARTNPELFKAQLLVAFGRTTEYGALAWNRCVDEGTANYSLLRVDPERWLSQSRANGELTIGAARMPAGERNRLLFLGEGFTYTDEVVHRLTHEISHGILFLTQFTPEGQALLRMAKDLRRQHLARGQVRGLSALGSLDFYRDIDTKVVEDVTELIAMGTRNPAYLDAFTAFLADDRMRGARDSVGLTSFGDADVAQDASALVITLVDDFVKPVREQRPTFDRR